MPFQTSDIPPIRPIAAKAGATLDVFEVFGRNDAVELAISYLKRGENLLLDEPRRFGKTSFAELLVSKLPTGWFGRKVSLQGRQTTTEVAISLLGTLRSAVGEKRGFLEIVGRYVRQIDLGPFQLSVAYEDKPLVALEQAVQSISESLLRDGTRLVLSVDELTEVVREIGKLEGPSSARAFLGTLRRLREECRGVLWVLTGSIGFHHVLTEIGATSQAINNTKVFKLGPLDPIWASWLAGCVLLDAGIEQNSVESGRVRDEIARATDGIAILVHMIGEHVRDEGLKVVAVEDVGLVLDECFLRNDRSANLTHLLTRIDDYYGENIGTAEILLDEASSGNLQAVDLTEKSLRIVVEMLIEDHYLERTVNGQLAWKYQSLQRLWRVRRGLMR